MVALVLASAVEHYRRQQRITVAGIQAAKRARGKGSLEVARVVTGFQVIAARDAVQSVDVMLSEQNVNDQPVASVVPSAVAGTASDGRSLDTLFQQAQTEYQFGLMVATQLQDAARAAAGVSIAARTKVGYVRMMNPPSCSRCAVLAGKWFKYNQGFQRHPRCDCRHIPAMEADYGDVTLSGDKWFHSLGGAEQDRVFTKAGAQAIRDGADLNQVVNARRGMFEAQPFGKQTLSFTREGITKRGLYGSSDPAAAAGYNATRVGQRGYVKNSTERTTKRARIMPETIYRLAPSRAEAQRLLRLYGYIL